VGSEESVGDTNVDGPVNVASRERPHTLDDDVLTPDKTARTPDGENKESVSHDFTKGTKKREITEECHMRTRHRTVVALLLERRNPQR
jgi:hypothetical protein